MYTTFLNNFINYSPGRTIDNYYLRRIFENNNLICFYSLTLEYPEEKEYFLHDNKLHECERVKNTSYFLRLKNKALILIVTVLDDNCDLGKRCNLQIYISSNTRTSEYCDPLNLENLDDYFKPIDIHEFFPYWCDYNDIEQQIRNTLYNANRLDIKDGNITHKFFLPDIGLQPPYAACNKVSIYYHISSKLEKRYINEHISSSTFIQICSQSISNFIKY